MIIYMFHNETGLNMLKIFLIGITLMSSVADGNFADVDIKPVMPEMVYVPLDVTEGERVKLVITGHYPDSCYKNGPTKTSIDASNMQIRIQSTALKNHDSMCLMALAPYVQVVDLGKLMSGFYRISFYDHASVVETKQPLEIRKKDPLRNPEKYPYVEDALVINEDGRYVVRLRGLLPSSCYFIDRVEVKHGNDNVIEIKPLLAVNKMLCTMVTTPFEYKVPIDRTEKGEFLVRVKTASGDPLNAIGNIE
ncbi:MAG: hypothetical protein A2583_15355 [Bdellovibrionales bacterium RIFOXYD1_FULL_53_11]|nr:MAG: hypothetical protein A2583_15355 [Bdellovibrionales bacterium RIFOXYD1_FULL_53_11]